MTMLNLLKTNFMPTVLPSQVTYEKLKKNISQYNKKVFIMPP